MPFDFPAVAGLSLEEAVDLASLPRRRHFNSHPFIDRLRKAVPFDYIAITGLDFDNYRYGSGASIDTDIPPAFLDAYYGDGMLILDPFVTATHQARGPVAEADVYRLHPPPERLRYLTETFGVHNRTLFPILRSDVVFGAVILCRKTPFTSAEIDFIGTLAKVVYSAITRPILEKFQMQSLKLSEGEVICLRLSSHGRTSEVIAVESGYAVDTVNTYIKSAIRKLGATNRVHGVAEAIRRGLIA